MELPTDVSLPDLAPDLGPVARRVAHAFDDVTSEVGDRTRRLGRAIGDLDVPDVPDLTVVTGALPDVDLGSAAHTVGRTARSLARSGGRASVRATAWGARRGKSLAGRTDVFVRRHPWAAVATVALIAAIVGYLVARRDGDVDESERRGLTAVA